jgi:cell division protein FtsL
MNGDHDQPSGKRSRRIRSLLLNGALFLAVFVVLTAYQTRNMLSAGGLRAVVQGLRSQRR